MIGFTTVVDSLNTSNFLGRDGCRTSRTTRVRALLCESLRKPKYPNTEEATLKVE
jgi:hypothetical protein